MVDDHHPLAERRHVLGLVRRQQHRVLLGDGRHGLAEPQPLLRIEPRCRFVEHQQLGVSEQRLGDDHTAAHAAREGLDALVHHVVESDLVNTRRTSS